MTNNCMRWPFGFSGKSPNFQLSDSEKRSIADILGEEQLGKIDVIATAYLIEKENREKNSVNELNNGLFELGNHAESLINLLENKPLLAHFQNKVQSIFNSEELAAKLVKNPYSTHPSASIIDDLKIFAVVCNHVKQEQKATGRRAGVKIAEHKLVNMLYYKCYECTSTRPTNNPKGPLQQLIGILSRPLGLSSSLSGIVRKVIDENNPKPNERQ